MITFKTFITEGLSAAGRRSLARSMKRRRFQLARARKMQSRRRADSGRIKNRASRQARSDLYKKLLRGKSKSSVGFAKRKSVERQAKQRANLLKVHTRMNLAPKRRADRR